MPASAASQLFKQLKKIAPARQLEVSESTGHLYLHTSSGDYLDYVVFGDSIELVVAPNVEGGGEEALRTRTTQLKALSDALLKESGAKLGADL